MRIFLAPRSNETSYKNFLSTIENGLEYSLIEKYLNVDGKDALSKKGKLFAWGNKESKKASWDRMEKGDVVLFYKKGAFIYAGKVLYKQQSDELALALWPTKKGEKPWSCVYFLESILPISLVVQEFNKITGNIYKIDRLQGFMPVKDKAVELILNRFKTIDNFISYYAEDKTRDLPQKKFNEDISEGFMEKTSKKREDLNSINIRTEGEQANILDYRFVRSEVEKYKKYKNIIDATETIDHDIFLEICAKLFFGFSEDEAKEGIVSGKNDCGIDAVYIETGGDEEKEQVYLVQAKFHRNEEKYDRYLAEDALTKMQNAISSYILRIPSRDGGVNNFLLEKLNDIRGLTNPKINIVFFSNTADPSEHAQNKFKDFLDSKKGSGDSFSVKYVSLLQIATALRPKTRRKIDARLRLSGKYFDWTIGGVKVLIGRISGKEISKLRKEQGSELFDKNVRGYLKLRNEINKSIFETASDSVKAPKFFFLNNGVTIVCSNMEFLGVDESPELELEDLQIVNGGQTTNAIYEAENRGMLSDNTYLLIRIVQTNDQNLLDLITEATNTQTMVRSRDLHSNDPIQRTLERMLRGMGFYYESRANKYKDDPVAKGKRIDMVTAAQALYAFAGKRPADAKNRREDLTGELYYEIFNETTKPEDLLLSYKVLEYVRGMHNELKDKFTFAKYAEFHSIAMLGEVGIGELGDLIKTDTKKKYLAILKAIKAVVDEEGLQKGVNYSHRALFINQTTFGRIKEEYFDQIK